MLIQKQKIRENPYVGTEWEVKGTFAGSSHKVGILYDFAQEHQHYIAACHDLKINYIVVDIRKSNWIQELVSSECKVFLVWPTIYKPIHKQFWDERLSTMVLQMGLKVFPSIDLLKLYESKRMSRDWLMINDYPHPATEIFFDKKDALNFAKETNYPIVLKTDQGASSSGVYIIKTKSAAQRWIKIAFGRGIKLKNKGQLDVHRGYVIFQEYLPNCKEWRLIRVGESFFCRLKLKKGDFHSGSGDIVWAKPPRNLLDLTKDISQKFQTPNVNIDYFETEQGDFLINEIHALWGGKVIKDEELEGRYVQNPKESNWSFEKGDFFGRRCAELRLHWLVNNEWI
jgi:hypothetical protein